MSTNPNIILSTGYVTSYGSNDIELVSYYTNSTKFPRLMLLGAGVLGSVIMTKSKSQYTV